MKLTSLFHLSLITLAVGLTADLTAAEKKSPEVTTSEQMVAPTLENISEQNRIILTHLYNKPFEEIQKEAAQPDKIQVSPTVYRAVKIIEITEREQSAKAVEDIVVKDADISLEAAMAWYTAYMQAVAAGEIKLGEHTNLNGAVGACVVKLIEKNINREGRSTIQIDNIIKFLFKNTKLASIKITREDGTYDADAAQYMFMMTTSPQDFCPQYESLENLKSIFKEKVLYGMGPSNSYFYEYISLLPKQSIAKILTPEKAAKLLAEDNLEENRKTIEAYKKQCAEESEKEQQAQAQSATAAAQQSKAAQTSATPQSNPAPVSAAPQPSAQSSSASAQADVKARADQAATGSNQQPLIFLTFGVFDDSITRLSFNKEESLFILAHLLYTDIEGLRRFAAQSQPIYVSNAAFSAIMIVKASEQAETTEAVREDIGIGIDKKFRSSEGNQIWHTAYMQAVTNKEIQPQADRDLLAAVFPPAPAPAPAQPKSIFTRVFHTHPWLCSGLCILAGAAAIYGGYRLYKHVNMGKLPRYAGI